MKMRFNYPKAAPGVYEAMDALDQYLAQSSIDERLLNLVRLRASLINHCAYCIDMHWKDLRALGETEQRLYGMAAWQESPYYSDRERAALAWTEAVTLVAEGQVSERIYREVQPHFTDSELADLTMAVATINAWNRLSVASRLEPGKYQSTLKPAVAV